MAKVSQLPASQRHLQSPPNPLRDETSYMFTGDKKVLKRDVALILIQRPACSSASVECLQTAAPHTSLFRDPAIESAQGCIPPRHFQLSYCPCQAGNRNQLQASRAQFCMIAEGSSILQDRPPSCLHGQMFYMVGVVMGHMNVSVQVCLPCR